MSMFFRPAGSQEELGAFDWLRLMEMKKPKKIDKNKGKVVK